MLIIIEGCSSESQTEREGKEQGKGAAINQYKIVESIENMKRVWSQITKTHKEKVLKKRCLMSQATLRRVGVLRLCGIVWQVNKNEPTKSVANKKMFAAELFTKRLQQHQQHGARRTQHLAYLASSCNIPATLPLPLVSIADFFGGPRRVGAAQRGHLPQGGKLSLLVSLPRHVGRGVRNFKQIFTQAGPGPRSVQDDHQVAIGCGCDHYVFTAAIFGATFMQNKQPATCLHPSILHRRRQAVRRGKGGGEGSILRIVRYALQGSN